MRRAVDQDTADHMDEANTDLSSFDAVASSIKKRVCVPMLVRFSRGYLENVLGTDH